LRDRMDEAMLKIGVKTEWEALRPHLIDDHAAIAETPVAEPVACTERDFAFLHAVMAMVGTGTLGAGAFIYE
jgi:hypothetical protein